MRVLLQFGAHALAIRCIQLSSLRPFLFVAFPVRFKRICAIRWIHIIKGVNELRTDWEGGHPHSNLITIGRDSLKATCTFARSDVNLLSKLVSQPSLCRHTCAPLMISDVAAAERFCISSRNAMVYLAYQWWPAAKSRGSILHRQSCCSSQSVSLSARTYSIARHVGYMMVSTHIFRVGWLRALSRYTTISLYDFSPSHRKS